MHYYAVPGKRYGEKHSSYRIYSYIYRKQHIIRTKYLPKTVTLIYHIIIYILFIIFIRTQS